MSALYHAIIFLAELPQLNRTILNALAPSPINSFINSNSCSCTITLIVFQLGEAPHWMAMNDPSGIFGIHPPNVLSFTDFPTGIACVVIISV